MSSPSYIPFSPKHNSPPYPHGRENQARPPAQVLGSAVQNGYPSPTRAMAATTDRQAWQNSQFGLDVRGPVLQHSPDLGMGTERQPSLSPSSIAPQTQMPTETQYSRSSAKHLRTPSQLEDVARENMHLRQQVEDLCAERDRTQDACDNMLTELINTQESLQEAQAAIASKDAELSALQEQLAASREKPQGGGSSRDQERELRDLRLKCNRLKLDVERKDRQLEQARTQTLDTTGTISPQSVLNRGALEIQERLADAESRLSHATSLYTDARREADTYIEQIMGWKNAYDSLQASHSELQASQKEMQRSYAELSKAAQDTRARVDDQTVQKMQASKVALADAQQMTDFWKQNSEKLSKKNKEVTDQIRNVQDALNSKSHEVDQLKSMVEALQLQMN